MDDIFICGENSIDLHKAIKLIIAKAKEMGLTIKNNWRIFKINSNFVDIMGFRIYKKAISVRRHVNIRIKRAYSRVLRCIQKHCKLRLKQVRRCLSYWGLLKGSNSYYFRKSIRSHML